VSRSLVAEELAVTPQLQQRLLKLQNDTISILVNDTPDQEGTAHIIIKFADGTILKASYWRLIVDRKSRLSSFDHGTKYGLPQPIDAKAFLINSLDGKICQAVHFDEETADFVFDFEQNKKLQIFNFTSYEIWDILFPDGKGEYSNSALLAESEFQKS
jgi:hypothetical protein